MLESLTIDFRKDVSHKAWDEFDVVTFFEVLEHVRDVDLFLKQVNKVLKKRGMVYLSVPNATWWRNILKDIFLNKYAYAKKMHNWPAFSPDQRDHVNNGSSPLK